MTVRFERTTVLPTAPERAFDVALDVDFHLQSFEDADEQIVGGVRSGGMQLGDDVTWRARHFGVWWTMTSVITEFDRPHRFVDEQRSGPFERFHHEHVFTAAGPGSTSMFDVVEFEAPFGPLGRLAERIALARYLPRLIDQRNAALVRVLTP